jgi:hypothetical protein
MPVMDDQILFDMAGTGFRDWPWVALGVCLSAAALVWWRWSRARGRRQGSAGMLAAMAVVMTAGAGLGWWDHTRLVGHLQAGRVQVAEGVVLSHSVEAVRRRHMGSPTVGSSSSNVSTSTSWWESFLVGEVAFGFYRGSQVGFTNGEAQRVALRDGDRLRVSYVEDEPGVWTSRRIVRLERVGSGVPPQSLASR